jgi:NAD(P)-dependent dehydrogenase (short-subunit alcohol dehydrogenase family)
MRVWICADHEAELERTAALIAGEGGDARPCVVDLADPEQCAAFADLVGEGAQRLRTLVNNAAVLERVAVEHLSLDRWNHTLAVNLTAPFLLARDLVPRLDPSGGSVINVSSMAGVRPTALESAYCASKFGIEALTRCLALELRDRPVSVNTITPGIRIKPTSLTEEQVSAVAPQERRQWNDPDRIAPAFLWLAGLRGEVSGCRFDARELTEALERHGPDETLNRIHQLDEARSAEWF